MRIHTAITAVIGAALFASACTVKDVDIPAMSGPSTFANSILLRSNTDTLIQDGVSQAVITITATDFNGNAKNIPLRADITVGGVVQDYGRLNTKTPTANGTPLIYTAPPASLLAAGQVAQTVTIVVTPMDAGDFRSEAARQIDIRLVPQGVILPTNPNLAAAFTVNPSSPKVMEVATFDASTTANSGVACGSACLYAWDFGDGTTAAGQVTSHQYRTIGTYQATLTVTDVRGAQTTRTLAVVVAPGTPPTPDFTVSPQTPPVDVDVFFDASTSKPASGRTLVSYAWNFGDGSTGSGAQVTHRFQSARTFNVALTVTDDAGTTNLISKPLTVGGAGSGPTAEVTFLPAAPRAGQRVVFDAGASKPGNSGTIVSYFFDYGDGTSETSVSAQQSHIYSSAGTFVAAITVTDSNGKRNTKTVSVTVTP